MNAPTGIVWCSLLLGISASFSQHVGFGPTTLLFQHVSHCFRAHCGAAEGIVLSSRGHCPSLMYVRLFILLVSLSGHGQFSKDETSSFPQSFTFDPQLLRSNTRLKTVCGFRKTYPIIYTFWWNTACTCLVGSVSDLCWSLQTSPFKLNVANLNKMKRFPAGRCRDDVSVCLSTILPSPHWMHLSFNGWAHATEIIWLQKNKSVNVYYYSLRWC